MAERFRQIVDRIVEKWKSWSAKQKTIIISTAAVILVAVAIIAFAVTRPNYEVLTNVSGLYRTWKRYINS